MVIRKKHYEQSGNFYDFEEKSKNQMFYWGWLNGEKKLVKIIWLVATCQVATWQFWQFWQLPIGNCQLATAN